MGRIGAPRSTHQAPLRKRSVRGRGRALVQGRLRASQNHQKRIRVPSHLELADEDDVWEIDDAYASDGHRYDLRLHPDTLAIITREPYDE